MSGRRGYMCRQCVGDICCSLRNAVNGFHPRTGDCTEETPERCVLPLPTHRAIEQRKQPKGCDTAGARLTLSADRTLQSRHNPAGKIILLAIWHFGLAGSKDCPWSWRPLHAMMAWLIPGGCSKQCVVGEIHGVIGRVSSAMSSG